MYKKIIIFIIIIQSNAFLQLAGHKYIQHMARKRA